MMKETNSQKIKIFYCYAHEDLELLDKIKKQVSSLQSIELFTTSESDEEQERVVEEQLNIANIILLFVSPDFIASAHCKHVMQLALRQETAWVLPIILRPVIWEDGPLGKIQALPNGGMPVTSHPNLDEAIKEVVEGIRKVVERLRRQEDPAVPRVPDAKILTSSPLLPNISRRTLIWSLLVLGIAGIGGFVFLKLGVAPPTLIYKQHSDSVSSVSWSPDDMFIASASVDKTVQVWSAQTGENIYTFHGHTDKVWSAIWSPNAQRIASAGDDDLVKIWDALTGADIYTYNGHNSGIISYGGVLCVAWSPDGKRIVSGSADAYDNVQVWDAVTEGNAVMGGHPLIYQGFANQGHAYKVWSVSWSPDGKHIASASENKTVQVWNAVTGGTTFTYTNHSNMVMSAAWSPDGKRIASASLDKTVQIWDALTGDNALTYTNHTDGAMCVAWSPDGKRIASASIDQTVQVWEALTGKRIFTYTGHTDIVTSVAWSPDGKRIVSASQDKTAQIWNVP